MNRITTILAAIIVFFIPIVLHVTIRPYTELSRRTRVFVSIAALRRDLITVLRTGRGTRPDQIVEHRAPRKVWASFLLRGERESEDHLASFRLAVARDVVRIAWFYAAWTTLITGCVAAGMIVVILTDQPARDRLRYLAFTGIVAAFWVLDVWMPRYDMKQEWREFGIRTSRDMRSIGRCPKCTYKIMPVAKARSLKEKTKSTRCPECGYVTAEREAEASQRRDSSEHD